MMKKKLLSLLLLSLCFPLMAIAQTLVLHHANGTTTDVELFTQPQVKFQNDQVLVVSTILKMEYPKEDVLKFTFKGKNVGIQDVNADFNVTKENGKIVFHGIKLNGEITIYNLKGIRVPVKILRHGNSATLPISSIPSGVYLLNVNGKTSKFTKP